MVRILFYATQLEMFSQEISHLQSLLFDTELLFISDRTDLICMLPELCREQTVVILFASSDEELEDLVNIKEKFASMPTVLVLPDDHVETFQKGMLLHPLYFMARQDDFRYFSSAIDDLCHIYKNHPHKSVRRSPGEVNSQPIQ